MSTETIERSKTVIDLEQIRKKQVHLAIFGHGSVGSILIDQIISSSEEISKRRNLQLNIFAVANSTSVLLNKNGIDSNWFETKTKDGIAYTVEDVIAYAKNNNLENLIAIDNTANRDFVVGYKSLIEQGFSLVSSNKIGNTLSLDFYNEIRTLLSKNNKHSIVRISILRVSPIIIKILNNVLLKRIHLSVHGKTE